jgi:hypothetical protein
VSNFETKVLSRVSTFAPALIDVPDRIKRHNVRNSQQISLSRSMGTPLPSPHTRGTRLA